jgi:hypothetical protein
MARQQEDREDLLREATGLVERVELEYVEEQGRSIVAGYRSNGALSVFFGAAPVYQFNTDGELRRAFRDDCPIKAQSGELIRMKRVEEPDRTVLHSHTLSVEEKSEFLARATDELQALSRNLANGTYLIIGQVPLDADNTRRLQGDLERLTGESLRVADVPNVM